MPLLPFHLNKDQLEIYNVFSSSWKPWLREKKKNSNFGRKIWISKTTPRKFLLSWVSFQWDGKVVLFPESVTFFLKVFLSFFWAIWKAKEKTLVKYYIHLKIVPKNHKFSEGGGERVHCLFNFWGNVILGRSGVM